MLLIILRATNTVFAVVVAVVVSGRYGETSTGKLLTVGITSAVVALFEVIASWSPKRFATIRHWLDPRSVFSGVWIQDVVQVYGHEGAKTEWPNRYAVLSVSYDKASDNYAVEGTAYTPEGEMHSRWSSTDVVHFAKNGRSVTYEWRGTIVNQQVQEDPRRTGFASLRLTSDNGGHGRVDHVAIDVILEFDITRVTTKWLAEHKLTEFRPEDLNLPEARARFAAALSKAFPRRKTSSRAASA